MSILKNKCKAFFLYQQNRLSNRLETQLKLINLKCELLHAKDHFCSQWEDHEQAPHKTSIKSLQRRMDLIDKMKKIHKAKVVSFRCRATFFESFVANNANRRLKANQTTLLCKILLKEAERKYQLKKFELVMLELKKEKLKLNIDKYKKFHTFISESQVFFNHSTLDFQDTQQIINHYDSLVYMANDTKEILDASSEMLASLKVNFSNLIEYASDQAIWAHESKSKLQANLNDHLTINLMLKEETVKKLDLIIKKCIDFDLIFKSVNNMFSLLTKSFKSNSNLVYNKNDFSHKLKVIKENFNDIKEVYLCLHGRQENDQHSSINSVIKRLENV